MLTKVAAQAIAEGLKNCPFCGAKPTASIRGTGISAMNPKAKCVTEDCMGGKLPVICLDVQSHVDAWNTRVPNQENEPGRAPAALGQALSTI